MILLLYLIISNLFFAVLISNGELISDKHFFQSVVWSYIWPYEIISELFFGVNKIADQLDPIIEKFVIWNEKFRNLLYFILYGITE